MISGVAVPGPIGVAGAVFGWLLLTLAALDVAEFWLPDALTGALAVAGWRRSPSRRPNGPTG